MREAMLKWLERVFGEKPAAEALTVPDRPLFRNDDVCWDTPLEEFSAFCQIFWSFGFRQLHGVTLHGKIMIVKGQGGDSSGPYDGYPDLCYLSNEAIRDLSVPYPVAARNDLLAFLANSPDEIALHGLYHSDYGKMTVEEQNREIREGVRQLTKLFPGKEIHYFIAPFNRTNDATHAVCRELGLELLAAQGVHLEAELSRLRLRNGVWYRYHHHRFYSESNFSYYTLSLKLLEDAFHHATGR